MHNNKIPKWKFVSTTNKVYPSDSLNFKLQRIYKHYQNNVVNETTYQFVASVWEFYAKNNFITTKQFEKINKIFAIAEKLSKN